MSKYANMQNIAVLTDYRVEMQTMLQFLRFKTDAHTSDIKEATKQAREFLNSLAAEVLLQIDCMVQRLESPAPKATKTSKPRKSRRKAPSDSGENGALATVH